jgi:hypothetical protein
MNVEREEADEEGLGISAPGINAFSLNSAFSLPPPPFSLPRAV